MKKKIATAVLVMSLAAGNVSAEGREAKMTEDQVTNAMISTSGSLVANPSSSPASSAVGSMSGVAVVLLLATVILLAISHSGQEYYSPS